MAEYKTNGIDGDYVIYKDKPLVRNGNMYCYGDMSDDYVMNIMVFTTKKTDLGDGKTIEVPDHVLVQIMSTDKTKSAAEQLVKQFEKNGLYDALDIGLIWLQRLNKNS